MACCDHRLDARGEGWITPIDRDISETHKVTMSRRRYPPALLTKVRGQYLEPIRVHRRGGAFLPHNLRPLAGQSAIPLDSAPLVSQCRRQSCRPLGQPWLTLASHVPPPEVGECLNCADRGVRRSDGVAQLPISPRSGSGGEKGNCKLPAFVGLQGVLMRDLADPWPVFQESLLVILAVLAERIPNRLALIRRERTEEPAQVRVPVASGRLARRHWGGTLRGESLPARCRGCLHRTVILVVGRTRNSTSWRCWRKPMCRRLAGIFLLALCSPEDTIWLVWRRNSQIV